MCQYMHAKKMREEALNLKNAEWYMGDSIEVRGTKKC